MVLFLSLALISTLLFSASVFWLSQSAQAASILSAFCSKYLAWSGKSTTSILYNFCTKYQAYQNSGNSALPVTASGGASSASSDKSNNEKADSDKLPDLDFPRSYGFIYGISATGCNWNGSTCIVKLSVVNNGNGTAGNFKVRAWISGNNVVDAGAKLIGTWNVPGIAAGQTLTGTVSGVFTGLPVHMDYYIIIKLDVDNQLTTETNKTNNTYLWDGTYIYR